MVSGSYTDLTNVHIDQLPEKVLKRLNHLYKVCWPFGLDAAKTMFQALIQLHFDVGDVVYCVSARHQLDELQKVQNEACQHIFLGDPYHSVFSLNKQLELDMFATHQENSLMKLTHVQVFE